MGYIEKVSTDMSRKALKMGYRSVDIMYMSRTKIKVGHKRRNIVHMSQTKTKLGQRKEDIVYMSSNVRHRTWYLYEENIYRKEKKIKLATYASRCIENEILMYLRRNNRVKLEVSFDEPLNTDWDGNELLLSDILGTDEDVIYKDLETEVEISLLKKAMLSLNERERQIIELRFGVNRVENKELTQKEVADILGISQSYISRLEKKIMARLKKEIQKMA